MSGGAYVEVGEVDGPHVEEHADAEQRVGQLLERVPLDQGSGAARGQAHTRDGQDYSGVEQNDKGHRAHRPAEADARQELLRDQREDDAARGAAAGGDGHGERAAGGEVGGDEGDSGAEDEAVAEALADALGEEELPVCEDLQGGAEGEHGAVVAGVEGAAGKGADEVDEEDLHGADPGDGRGRGCQRAGVVRLEEAEGGQVAPAVDQHEVAHQHLRPGLEAAVRRGPGVDLEGASRGAGDGEGVFEGAILPVLGREAFLGSLMRGELFFRVLGGGRG